MPKLYKIRPLVFHNMRSTSYEAETKFCHYTIWKRDIDNRVQWRWNYSSSGSGQGAHDCTSPQDGMSQAREHYECELGEELEEVDR